MTWTLVGLVGGMYLLIGMCIATLVILDPEIAADWAGLPLADRIGMLAVFLLVWPALLWESRSDD